MSSILSISGDDLSKLANMADKMWEITSSTYQNVDAVKYPSNENILVNLQEKTAQLSLQVNKLSAEISVIPPTPQEKRSIAKLELFAANGTKIKTYGQKLLKLDLGLRRAFNWPFVIADVTKAIIGMDFLAHFNLLMDSKNRKVMD
ncbi:retrovirus-related Pol polyprotein from transposon 17.6 [Trichonephila clavata]|uniref:Retrovirus-related Pol polyprotein from transposon 17.6 n=1 Tax=Trichonephila clavata TaxID=2740835 RepID=A0A8X6LV78_TRICU|nr:retrovirus-related Pol polyprotein from transposon 17.6 [Trichonephila clavata]